MTLIESIKKPQKDEREYEPKNILLIYKSKLMREMLEIVIRKEPLLNLLPTRVDSRLLNKDLKQYHVDCVIMEYSLWNDELSKYQRASENHPETNFLAISRDAERVFLKESINKLGLNLSELFGLIIDPDHAEESFLRG